MIFDAFGTLLSTGTGSVDACRKILAKQEKKIDPALFYARWKDCNKARKTACKDLGFLPEREIFTESLGLLYRDFGIDRPFRQDAEIMLSSFAGRAAFPDVKEALDLKRKTTRFQIYLNIRLTECLTTSHYQKKKQNTESSVSQEF